MIKRSKSYRRILNLMLFLFTFSLALWCDQAKADPCTASMPDLVFANVSPIAGTDYFTSGTLTISCTFVPLGGNLLVVPNASVCVSLGPGGTATSTSNRVLVNGSQQISFNVYRDSTYAPSSIWGLYTANNSINTSFGSLLAFGTFSQTFQVYAKIPAAALVGASVVNSNDTVYTADFTGAGTVNYAFSTLLSFPCTSGGSTSFAFQARATVVNNCVITANPVAFGNSGTLTNPIRAIGSLSVQCVSGDAYKIALNGGTVTQNPSGRQMKNAVTGETISYQLSSSLDGTIWGDGTGGTTTYTGTGTGNTQNVTVYGMVPVQPTPSPGAYKDTVTATIYY